MRDHSPAEQRCDLAGVDPIILGLAAVDRLHVERVAEHEGDALHVAQVREPVPGEDALDGHDEVAPVGSDQLQERPRSGGNVLLNESRSGLVDDADVHRSGMQIDAAVVAVLFGVESHRMWPPAWNGLATIPAYPSG